MEALKEAALKLSESLYRKAKARIVDPPIRATARILRDRFRAQSTAVDILFKNGRVPQAVDIEQALRVDDTRFLRRLAGQLNKAYQGGARFAGRRTEVPPYTRAAGVFYDLDRTTAKWLSEDIQTALQQGLRSRAIRKLVSDKIADYSARGEASRAGRAAVYEVSRAFHQGMIDHGGQRFKVWMIQYGACPICIGNAGDPVPLNQPFASGAMAPPQHSFCKCSMRLVRAED